ncbi:MAG: ABC transporter substrate-binding protein [Candidatus Ancillula sp.]|jgi:ABC-type nitrate/sulfonate/bicarbonate transport system substrate-binding protein|nr:ABC transporter substrate-binding protein [Candidatus Ancillula sp.]
MKNRVNGKGEVMSNQVRKRYKLFVASLLSLVLMVAVAVALTSCGESQQSQGLEDVTLVLDWTPNTNHSGIYLAKEKGYYKDLGINLSIQQPPEDGALPLVSEGKAQFGIDYQEYTMSALENGAKVLPVATVLQHDTSMALSLKEKNINSPKDLEGKTVLYADGAMAIDKFSKLIKDDGGNPDTVKWVDTACDDATACLMNKNVDAITDIYWGWEGLQTELNGLDVNIIHPAKLDPMFDFYSPIMVVNQDFYNEHPQSYQKFMEATKKGYEEAAANPEEAASILEKSVEGLKGDLVHKSQEYLSKEQLLDDSGVWGAIDSERWNKISDSLFGYKILKDKPQHFNFEKDFKVEVGS